MSSLAHYLAPTRVRSNPGYTVEWRHAEGGPWLAMASARSRKDAASELASPAVALTQGDLARVLDTRGRIVGFSVMAEGELKALPAGGDKSFNTVWGEEEMERWCRSSGYDWERLWEKCEHAGNMLFFAGRLGLDDRPLVLAACDCAETALPYLPPGEDRPRQALEDARRWALVGKRLYQGPPLPAAGAQDATLELRNMLGDRARAVDAAWAARSAADVTRLWYGRATGGWHTALYTALATRPEGASRDDLTTTLAALAVLVRQRIPLWELALGVVTR